MPCQNQGTRLFGAATSRNAPSASDARLGRSRASHINPSFGCRLHCSSADPTIPKVDSTTLEAISQGRTREMRPLCWPAFVSMAIYTAQHARHGSESPPLCALVVPPKITLLTCLSLGKVLHQLACSDISEGLVPRLNATDLINNYIKSLRIQDKVSPSNLTRTL